MYISLPVFSFTEVVKALLTAGASLSVKLRAPRGSTPSLLALGSGNVAAAKMIWEISEMIGADVANDKSLLNAGPLNYAIMVRVFIH